MHVARVSDPNTWCSAELDGSRLAENLDRLLADIEFDPAAAEPNAAAKEASADLALLADTTEVLESILRSYETVIPTRVLVATALDIWELADTIDPAISAPLEALLKHLKARRYTTTDEVIAVVADVRRALADRPAPHSLVES